MVGVHQRFILSISLSILCALVLSVLPGCAGGSRGTNISGSGTVRSAETGSEDGIFGTVTNGQTGVETPVEDGKFVIPLIDGEQRLKFSVLVDGKPVETEAILTPDANLVFGGILGLGVIIDSTQPDVPVIEQFSVDPSKSLISSQSESQIKQSVGKPKPSDEKEAVSSPIRKPSKPEKVDEQEEAFGNLPAEGEEELLEEEPAFTQRTAIVNAIAAKMPELDLTAPNQSQELKTSSTAISTMGLCEFLLNEPEVQGDSPDVYQFCQQLTDRLHSIFRKCVEPPETVESGSCPAAAQVCDRLVEGAQHVLSRLEWSQDQLLPETIESLRSIFERIILDNATQRAVCEAEPAPAGGGLDEEEDPVEALPIAPVESVESPVEVPSVEESEGAPSKEDLKRPADEVAKPADSKESRLPSRS